MNKKYRATKAPEEIENKRNRTGAKKAKKSIAAFLLVGSLAICSVVGINHSAHTTSSSKVRSLVADHTVNDCLFLPEHVTINQAYDLNYCDGEKLYDEISKKGIRYCEALDEFYTFDGRDIAILTVSGTCAEFIPADCDIVNGAKIFTAPEGYELQGEYACRIINRTYKRVIEKQYDYSDIQINDLNDATYTVEEVHSRPFRDIISEVLIVDVPDGAILDKNQECTGSFRLVPKE